MAQAHFNAHPSCFAEHALPRADPANPASAEAGNTRVINATGLDSEYFEQNEKGKDLLIRNDGRTVERGNMRLYNNTEHKDNNVLSHSQSHMQLGRSLNYSATHRAALNPQVAPLHPQQQELLIEDSQEPLLYQYDDQGLPVMCGTPQAHNQRSRNMYQSTAGYPH